MVRKLVIAVAAASAVMSSGMVHALGVGDIHLNSALNQPLDAEIDLTQVRDLSGDEIRSMLCRPMTSDAPALTEPSFLPISSFSRSSSPMAARLFALPPAAPSMSRF